MSAFHITRGGRAAPCEATTRACPLGEHYASMKAAARAVIAGDLATLSPGSSRGLPDGQSANGLPDGHEASVLTPSPVVPFGKYRGQAVSKLLADQAYCRWLLTQEWFRQNYPNVHQQVRRNREVTRLRDDFHRL